MSMDVIEEFRIDVPQAELDDLRGRLARTRWPDQLPGVGWDYGIALDDVREPAGPADRELVSRYAAAFENADMAALVALLREDAVLEMPPLPGWFRGRDAVAAFLGTHVLGRPGGFRMIPTAANGQPAFAAYARDRHGGYHAHGICVLTLAGPEVSRIVSFSDPGLFPGFGFPARLPAGEREPVPCGG